MASPTPPPVQVSAATRALAQRSDVDALTAAVASAVTAEVYVGHTSDPAFLAALNTSVRDNVTAALGLFAGTSTLADIRPPAAFVLTDMLAELGVPVSEVERSYWVGMSRFWQEWFALARAAAEAGEGTVEEFVGPPTELMFRYLIDVVALVVARHEAVSAEIRRSRDDKRRALVAEMVDGTLTEATEEVERNLGYRLNGIHLALALQVAGRRDAERLTGELSAALEVRGSLVLLQGAGTWLIWLGLHGQPGLEMFEGIEAIARADSAALCVGEAGTGLAGFLQTRHDALEVAELRRRLPRRARGPHPKPRPRPTPPTRPPRPRRRRSRRSRPPPRRRRRRPRSRPRAPSRRPAAATGARPSARPR